jgi:thiol-disulfide isomerase/thioredoxin
MDQDASGWKTLLTRANQLVRSATHPAAQLPVEGTMPSLDTATGWLNSPPLTTAELRGRVVLVNFWTYTCINWLRTLPYLRAWADRYTDQGLLVIGVHTPEFGFEHDLDNVRRAVKDLGVDYPVAVDNDYAIWNAFSNHYWPAFYFVDARGVEAAANWASLRSPENYLGYERTDNFVSPNGSIFDTWYDYAAPTRLRLNHWALAGAWTAKRSAVALHQAGGRILYRFHARDLHLVMGPAAQETSARFHVRIGGQPPGGAHGTDVDDQGNGTLTDPRLYQLVRQPGPVTERTLEISFLDPGVQAYAFTFG